MGGCLSGFEDNDELYKSMEDRIKFLEEEVEFLKLENNLKNSKIDMLENELYIYKKYC